MTLTPRPYQLIGRDFLASRRFALLADEMRVGKTPQAILAAHKAGAKTVLVATRAIAVPQWEREFRRWWPGEIQPRTLVLSWEGATNLWRSGVRGRVDCFIPDEAHFAKNPEAQRTKMVYGKDGFAQQAGAVWPLSGTPAPKHAGELWVMLHAFGVVGMQYDEFLRRYCTIDSWTKRVTGTKVAMIPELKALLATVMLRRTRKEVAPDMPAIDFQFLEVTPGKVDLKQDVTLPDEALLKALERSARADKEDRIAVAMHKAAQLANEIEFAIENGLLKQTVVFGWHVEPLKYLTQLLKERGIHAATLYGSTSDALREATQDNFRNGTIQVICANILTAGTAIDLSAANHGFFLELDWVPGNNTQAANRLISMEKSEPVSFDVVTWRGSVDDRLQRIILRRAQELAILY